ncbi:MAG: cupredoxin family copper-binding protein [bacterium]
MGSKSLKSVIMGILLLALVAFASSEVKAQTVDVDIVSFTFSPDPVNITTGTTVRWTNQDGVPHTSTSDGAVWNSGTLGNGQQFSYTFNTPGSYPYHCNFHPSMLGTINVSDPGVHVPSMSSNGLILLSMLLAVASVWFIYRRQQAASIS